MPAPAQQVNGAGMSLQANYMSQRAMPQCRTKGLMAAAGRHRFPQSGAPGGDLQPKIAGGWARGGGDVGHFGVKLGPAWPLKIDPSCKR